MLEKCQDSNKSEQEKYQGQQQLRWAFDLSSYRRRYKNIENPTETLSIHPRRFLSFGKDEWCVNLYLRTCLGTGNKIEREGREEIDVIKFRSRFEKFG